MVHCSFAQNTHFSRKTVKRSLFPLLKRFEPYAIRARSFSSLDGNQAWNGGPLFFRAGKDLSAILVNLMHPLQLQVPRSRIRPEYSLLFWVVRVTGHRHTAPASQNLGHHYLHILHPFGHVRWAESTLQSYALHSPRCDFMQAFLARI